MVPNACVPLACLNVPTAGIDIGHGLGFPCGNICNMVHITSFRRGYTSDTVAQRGRDVYWAIFRRRIWVAFAMVDMS